MKRHIDIKDADAKVKEEKAADHSAQAPERKPDESAEVPESGSLPAEVGATGGDAAADKKEEPTKKSELEYAKEKEKELLDQLQRLAAEFENYKKKNAREYSRGREEGIAYAVESVIPALESLSLAVEAAQKKPESVSAEGFDALRRQMLAIFESLGVGEINPKEGDALDLQLHEVLLAQPSEKIEAGKILFTVQRGYAMGGRAIKTARVCVVKEPVN